jgi:predicted nucleotidyltransferase component of viral defense system
MFRISPQQQATIDEFSALGASYFPKPILEKDLVISEILFGVSQVSVPDLAILFGGGTSLVKSRALMDRLSEDVDLKVSVTRDFHRSELRRKLRIVRHELSNSLVHLEFGVEYLGSHSEGQFSVFEVNYESVFPASPIRPRIHLDLWEQPLLLDPEHLKVKSILFSELKSEEPRRFEIPVVNLNETIAQKVIAFLRRLQQLDSNPKLVRHVYDIWRVQAIPLDMELMQRVFDYSLTEMVNRLRLFDSPFEACRFLRSRLDEMANHNRLADIFESQMLVVATRLIAPNEALWAFRQLAEKLISASAYTDGHRGQTGHNFR